MDVAAALSSKSMFGPWFQGKSWDGWRAVLRAAYALPMTAAERKLFRFVADREPPRRPVKEPWIVAGRRSGKDSVASAVSAHIAASFDPAGLLRPGEKALVACLAVDRAQARTILGYTRAYFENIPVLQALVEHETSEGFSLTNGVDIAIVTNDYRAVRGKTIAIAVLDECAFWKSEATSSPDREVYRALRPGMATLPMSMLIGISSAHRRAGLLYERYQKYYGAASDRVLVIKAPSQLLNPTLSKEEIDDALADDPEAARAEFLSEWRDDLASYLPRDLIEGAVDRGVTVRPREAGRKYFAFVDPSGGRSDSFAAAIAHRERDDTVMLDCLVEIRSPFNPQKATAQIARTLKEYGVRHARADRYAAEWPVAEFAKNGVDIEHAELDKSQIYIETLSAFSAGRVRLLDNDRLVGQFAALERRTFSGGRDKVDHPRGANDDLSNAAAGALWMSATKRKPLRVTQETLERVRKMGRRPTIEARSNLDVFRWRLGAR